MIINELYDMAKEFVNDFEEAETEVIQYLKTELDKNNYDVELSQEEKEEIKEMYKNDIGATIENKTAISRAGLQALIVSDFVNDLSPDLQYQIRKECMSKMKNKQTLSDFERYEEL